MNLVLSRFQQGKFISAPPGVSWGSSAKATLHKAAKCSGCWVFPTRASPGAAWASSRHGGLDSKNKHLQR